MDNNELIVKNVDTVYLFSKIISLKFNNMG